MVWLELPIKINEIFHSIQGESSLVGWPTTFVRTSGCNIRCTYCDTKYSYYDGQKMTVREIIEKVKSCGGRHVCITGGEPLAQNNVLPLMALLCDEGYTVSLETNGHYSTENVDPRVVKVVDVKTPGSGEVDSFLYENLKYLDSKDQVKFVICNDQDYDWAKGFIAQHDLSNKCQVFFSPSFEEMTPRSLAEKILRDFLPVRLQLQLHKYIWNPNQRGV